MNRTDMLNRVTDKQAAIASRFLRMMKDEHFYVEDALQTLEYARVLMEDEINQKDF